MHLFKFTTKTAYINSLKTVKALENELRDLHSNVYTSSYYINGKEIESSIDIEEFARPFLLYTQCYKRFEEKSKQQLPEFLYTRRFSGATAILDLIVTKNLPVSYEQYIDIFKHMGTNDIILPVAYRMADLELRSGMEVVIKLSEIIGDNPNPYNLNYSRVMASSLYAEACYGHATKAMILQAIAIRQVLLNDKTYTVLEDFITRQSSLVTLDLEEAKRIVNMGKILTSAAIEYQGLANA